MDQWQYLIVLGGCVLITAPLEVFGAGVYRQPVRLLLSVLPVALVFLGWDAIAISGIDAGFAIPLEELLFFLIIPLCGLLTYSAVSTIPRFLRRPMRVRDELLRR